MINQTIKNTIAKKTLVLSAAFITLCAVTVNAQKANFSGEWKLNEQKSTLGQYGGRMAAKKLKLNGQTDSLSIQRTATSQDGNEVTMNERLTFDGKETESTLFTNSKKKSTAKWSDDGKSLNVNSTITLDRNGETIEIKVTETWKLADDGKALTIESTSNSSFGTNTMKLVYDKA
jgi:hypothetical protein